MKPTSVGYTLTGFCIAGIADDESYMKTLESSIEEFAQDSAIARVKTRPSDDYDWIAINTATCILKNPK